MQAHANKILEFFIDNDTRIAKMAWPVSCSCDQLHTLYTYGSVCTVILFKLQHEPLIKLHANSFNLVKMYMHGSLYLSLYFVPKVQQAFFEGIIFPPFFCLKKKKRKNCISNEKKNLTSYFDFLGFYFKPFFYFVLFFFQVHLVSATLNHFCSGIFTHVKIMPAVNGMGEKK